MPLVNHAFVSAKAEQTDPTLVGPNEWNAAHVITAGQYFTATAGQTTFTPTTAPNSSSWCFVNGLKQRYGVTYDFTVVGINIIFNYGLQAGDVVEVIS